MDLISTEQAARELGVTRRRVQALIQSGRLKAKKVGRSYVIRPKDLEAVRVRKPGRQPKRF
jgi:excisionase family DNA binding protein